MASFNKHQDYVEQLNKEADAWQADGADKEVEASVFDNLYTTATGALAKLSALLK